MRTTLTRLLALAITASACGSPSPKVEAAIAAQDPSGASHDSRIRFMGAPSGYEFISLVQAVLLVGGRESTLTAENRARLAAVDKPVTMRVFTTPT